MSFFESSSTSTNGANTTGSSGGSEFCENCSSNFTIFKRKKTCNICRQLFCQACVNRHQVNTGGNSERICVICQSICLPQTTMDDLMKYKLKHLRSILTTANVATNTCKEKRDLAELVLRNRTRIQAQTNSQSGNNSSNQHQNQPSSGASNGFNNTINNFMSNVQDFVNFNLNSVANAAYPMPAANTTNTATSNSFSNSHTTSADQRNNTSSTRSSSNSSSNSAPGGSGHVPNVFNQTFTNNQFTFNNLFPGNPPSASASAATSDNTQQNTASNDNVDRAQNIQNPEESRASTNPSSTVRRRASLSDIKTSEDIENLTIKQIKEILACNFVDYKGCCEKKELVDKAKRLYASYLENKRLESEINETCSVNSYSNCQQSERQQKPNDESEMTDDSYGTPTSTSKDEQPKTKKKIDESDMCKICMEALIDCVLLDCGHMVSCIKCGKRLAECPMCRQNIVRVIRVFKS